MTAHSAIEATKFLLQEGTEFVLTERFCQDPVEEYFRIQWRSTSGINANLEDAVTILTSMHLDIMPTPSEFSGWFPVKVATQEAGKTNEEHGSRLQMQYCHAGKKLNIFDFSRSLSYMYCNCSVDVTCIYTGK